MKDKPIKIRREWVRHPATRIKEGQINKDICEQCGAYRSNPELCKKCYDDMQIGGA